MIIYIPRVAQSLLLNMFEISTRDINLWINMLHRHQDTAHRIPRIERSMHAGAYGVQCTLTRGVQCILILMISMIPRAMASCSASHAQLGHSCSGVSRITAQPNTTRTSVLAGLLANYDNLLRPQRQPHTPTEVICDLFINSFDSVSLDQMDYSMNIYSRQSWMDPRLAYKDDYPDLKTLTLDTKLFDMIWVPDLFFANEKNAHSHCVTVPNRLIRIYPNGTVLYSARYTLTLTCHMSLQNFPLDKQTCHIFLESYGYTLSEIQFRWREPAPIQINEGLELAQFDMVDNITGKCNKSYITGNFSCLKASFVLHRKYGYYMIQNYIPAMLIVILSWVSFWINIDAVPARISLGVLTVLTMTTQSVGAWMSLPRASYVKAIDIWISTCVCFVFLAMLEFAVVNTLARKEIRRMSMKVRANTANQELNSEFKRMLDEYTYGRPEQLDPSSRNTARKVDKVSRWVFPGAFFLFCVSYWFYFGLA